MTNGNGIMYYVNFTVQWKERRFNPKVCLLTPK